jgi:Ca2+-binding RTX toxin-like protein
MAGLANARRGLWADTPLAAPTEGPDSIVGTDAPETINGLDGDDTVRGHGGADVIRGGEGDDKLDGDEGKDILSGQKGDDTLWGVYDNDRLIGGEGNDTLVGLYGNDDYVFDPDWGVDLLAEGHREGSDRLVFRGIDVGDVSFTVIGNEIHIEMGANRILLANQYFFGHSASALFEFAQFGDVTVDLRMPHDEWLVRTGGPGADTIHGSIYGDTCSGKPATTACLAMVDKTRSEAGWATTAWMDRWAPISSRATTAPTRSTAAPVDTTPCTAGAATTRWWAARSST